MPSTVMNSHNIVSKEPCMNNSVTDVSVLPQSNENEAALDRSNDVFTMSSLRNALHCDDPRVSIRVEKLSVSYGAATILREVSLDIHEGCITALIGPSGCGKTTFLSCINRLIDLTPSATVKGNVTLSGVDIRNSSMNLTRLRRQVGMVFQRPNPFPLT